MSFVVIKIIKNRKKLNTTFYNNNKHLLDIIQLTCIISSP